MIARIIASIVLILPCAAFAENPFTTKFGGPYLSVDNSFKQSAALYGSFWMGTYSTLSKDALKEKAGFFQFLKEQIDPKLSALNPSGPQEEKVKAAATFVKTAFEAQVDPSKFKPDELNEIDAFITAAVPPGEDMSLSSKLGFTLIKYQEFVTGITLEQMKKLQRK